MLYGDRNNWFAAYTYWYLKYYGHDNVKLVNGPREKWLSEGRPTTTDVPPIARRASPPRLAMTPSERSATRCSRRSTSDPARRRALAAGVLGELIAMAGYEQEGAQRAGHIPGAASVPWAQSVQEDGTFKSADELRELYTAKGVITTATR